MATPFSSARYAIVSARYAVVIIATLCSQFLAGCSHNEGVTPLMLAARSGDNAALGKLLASGVEVDTQSRYGWTALMFACWKGHPKAVSQLLDAGADPNIRSESIPSQFETVLGHPPTTAMTEALRNHHRSIVCTLIERGAEIDPEAVALAGGEGDIELLEIMVDHGADLNQHSGNAFHASALCAAAKAGQLDTVKWLFSKGAKLDLIAVGQTALREAIAGDHLDVVQYLLDNGSDPNLVCDSTGESAFFSAVTKVNLDPLNSDDHLAIIKVLLSHGADKSHKAFSGQYTALDFIKSQRANAAKYHDSQTDPSNRQIFAASIAHQDAIIQLLEN